MLKRNRAIAIVMAFVFCMTFLAPAFIAPDVAKAGSTYDVLKAPTVSPGANKDLGVIKVTLDETTLFAYNRVTVSLPSDLNFDENSAVGTLFGSSYPLVTMTGSETDGRGIHIVAPGTGDALSTTDFEGAAFPITPNNCFDIIMSSGGIDPTVPQGKTIDRYFYIYFNGINLNNVTGDIKVSFVSPSGSGFSSALDVVIGKSTRDGSTLTNCKKVVDLTDAGGALDIITIMENSGGTLKVSENPIKFKILTKGFEWDSSMTATASYGWSWYKGTASVESVSATIEENGKTLKYDLNSSLMQAPSGLENDPGRVSFVGLALKVDDSKANPGDEVEIKVSGGNMDAATLVVAKYVDYDVKVEEGTTTTLIAGQNEQELGEFFIEEGAFGSLVDNRIVKLELPSGVEWASGYLGETNIVSGDTVTFDAAQRTGSNNEIVKWQVANQSTNDGARIKFKEMKVNVAPDFSGDLEIEVSGSAGLQGTIKVAEVLPAATIEIDEVNDIILGKPDQKLGDITITEGDVEALLDDKNIVLEIDQGYRFTKTPKVEVLEGDLDIDVDDVDTDERILTIPVDSQSVKTAGKILISDIYIDAYRSAPEGPVEIRFKNNADRSDKTKGTYATNETTFEGSPGKAVIANCVTAALGETVGNGQFIISSNIYEVNGVKKVMDAAPYIKNDRTYVPVRFLAYVLGLTDDDIIWDEASQKVTLTLGDTVVELTIGSTTMYVNGEAVQMDVAPEITNDRTFLPARWVAEAFGFQVGWDGATRTVLISK